ncbi:MAG: imidazole glycerol phosphate synthase subunit HisH [Provencibacterium sp.]|jgi:glutamine amidotransferase|nr:imidazole glycerol phosphate synthase subunit HisH [Provencibacterium sp.]
MIAVVDYGAGNLFSLCNSLSYLQLPYTLVSRPEQLDEADSIILPGVGAFRDAMEKLLSAGLCEPLRRQAEKKPLLGICLGMQLLFEEGTEFGKTQGLGLIPGRVVKIEAPGLRVPHIGWNETHRGVPCPLTEGLREGEYFYFVHSYRAETEQRYIALSTEYGEKIPALVSSGSVYGAQFHPEKSSAAGLQILKSFGGLKK